MKKNFLLKCIILSQTSFIAGVAVAETIELPTNIPLVQNQADVWYDGDKERVIWKSIDERAILHQHNPSVMSKTANYQQYSSRKIKQSIIDSKAKIIESTAAWTRIRVNEKSQNQVRSKKNSSKLQYSNVYYSSKTNGAKPLIATGEMIVHFNEAYTQEKAKQWGQVYDLLLLKVLNVGNAFVYACGNSDNCLQKSNTAYHDSDVKSAYPDWLRPVSKQLRSERLEINDTLFPEQWYLENTGQNGSTAGEDINILDVWWKKQYGSKNEIIAIVDDGLQIAHEDLKQNIIPNLSLNLVTGGNNPSPRLIDSDGDFAPEFHGTNVAGIVAARGGNGIGLSGTAPLAGLVGVRLLGNFTAANVNIALTHKSNQIDIYNNSWGPLDDAQLNGISLLEEETFKSGVRNGRGGKGSVFVFAAGNGRADGDNSNFDGYSNSPYTIAVAASNKLGKQPWYSENGANLWLNAPSSDDNQNIMITEPYVINSYATPRYSENFGGTSATAPQVSGVIALMLEQNSNLSWRDVQHVLAETAEKNDPTDGGWIKNGANFWVSHKYGFGRVDASAAAQLAADWELLPPQTTITASKKPNILIPDNDTTGITSTIDIEANLAIDYVEVEFTSNHKFWGDLEIILVSPEGTSSILAETGYGTGDNPRTGDAYKNGWRFGVARLLGESSQGTWTLRVRDKGLEDTGHLVKWSVKAYGSVISNSVVTPTTSTAPVNTSEPAKDLEISTSETTAIIQPEPDAAEQLMNKCIAKYPEVMGTKVGGTFSCHDGLLCQKTSGGDESAIQITSIGVEADNTGDMLSYFAYGNWYAVAFSKLNNCD